MDKPLLLKILNKLDILSTDIKSLDQRLTKVEAWEDKIQKIDKIDMTENKLDELYAIVSHIEIDHGKKLDALLDYVKINQDAHNEFHKRLEQQQYQLFNHDIRIESLENLKKA